MIRINLLPVRELEAEVGRRKQLTIASLGLGLIAILLVGFDLTQSSQLSSLEKEIAELRKEIKTLNAKAKGVADYKKNIRILKEKLKVIDELSKKKTGPARVMEGLSSATPTRLWLTEFRESEGNLSLNGRAADNQTIADFLKALSSSPYFKDIELVETTQVEEQGATLKNFVMRSKLLYQPPSPP
ncbi:MAG: PilN domain-containing protein [Candidatus Binatia bacterium]